MTQNVPTLMTLLVGMHFRPPAKTLLQALPSGTPLGLRPEPENPYDANAIGVYVDSASIPESQYDFLEGVLPGSGQTLEEVLGTPEWHLGYIAATGGKPLAKNPEYTGNTVWLPIVHEHCAASGTCEAKLAFAGDGQALVVMGAPVDA